MLHTKDVTFNSFLSSVKQNLEKQLEQNSNVTVVIGNESCDLDSAVSAITFAYLMHLNSLKLTNQSVTEGQDNNSLLCGTVVPVLNVHRKHYPIKTEVKYFLDSCNIFENNIIFRDEIDLTSLYKEKKLQLVLVDHHVLQNDLRDLEDCIVKVLDHRPKDKTSKLGEDIARITPVGSCCTLVADEIIRIDELILKDNQDVATLLHGTVVLDTFCFDVSIKRYTELDIKMTDKCRLLGNITSSNEEVFNRLKSAKIDVSGLTLQQLLMKDTKIVNCIPISTLTTLAKAFLEKPEAEQSITEFCSQYKAPVFILLGIEKTSSSFLRDVYIFHSSAQGNPSIHSTEDLASNILRHLNEYTLLDLVFVKDVFTGKLFTQTNIELTRKHILPIVENAYNDYIATPI